jgi:peptidoglycan/LPS O-acetylase OafA/YrhL
LKTQRILALDGIRAVAIAGVLAMHAQEALPGGHLGVSIFFVLSGYLITKGLLRERERTGRNDFKAFYIRRVARLAPALIVAIAVAMALALLRGAGLVGTLAGGGAALLYVTNLVRTFFGNDYLGGYGWAWTLSLEEQFYLVWPFLLLLTWRRSLKLSLVVAGAGVVGPFILRFFLPTLADPVPAQLYYGPHSRVSGLMLGCVVAIALWLWPTVWTKLTSTLAASASLAVIAASFWFADAAEVGTYTTWLPIVELASAVLVVAVLSAPRSIPARLLSIRPVAYFGLISYGVYLWNAVILDHVVLPLVLPHELALVLWLLLTLGVAAASYKWMEYPIMERVREKLRAKREPDKTLLADPV